MKKLTVSIVLACSISPCAADSSYSYREQGGNSVEERSYSKSYGGTTWYREATPYYPYPAYDQNRNSIPDKREITRNRNGVPNYREADRNRNGVPDQREQDQNHNGVPDYKEADRNRYGVPDQREQDRNHNGIPDNKEYFRN